MLARDRLRTPAGTLPRPMPLPSLSAALQCRAATFGPYDGDDAPMAPSAGPVRLGVLVRRVVDRLTRQVAA